MFVYDGCASVRLEYNYFRDYDPATGRYLESDPIGLAGGLNTYGYTGANPLSYIDPKGQSATVTVLPWAAGAAASDGPLPIGDAIGLIAIGGAAIYDMCSNGDDDECKKLNAKIKRHITGMKVKYLEMTVDEHNLFGRAFTTNPGGDLSGLGTWRGHQTRYDGLRKGLENMVKEAEAKGCVVSEEAYRFIRMQAPYRPGK